jgi:conjugal transfer pilus assembly protein TraF
MKIAYAAALIAGFAIARPRRRGAQSPGLGSATGHVGRPPIGQWRGPWHPQRRNCRGAHPALCCHLADLHRRHDREALHPGRLCPLESQVLAGRGFAARCVEPAPPDHRFRHQLLPRWPATAIPEVGPRMTIRNRPALPLLLTFAVMLGSHSAAAQDAASRYWADSWRGWHFYEAPAPEEHEHPLPPGKTTATAPPLNRRGHRNWSNSNVSRKPWKRRATSPSCDRAKPMSGATWNWSPRSSPAPPISPTSRSALPGPRPQLDPTLQGRPVNAKALEVFDQAELVDRSRAIADLGKDHVLFFFYRSDCPYCHAFAPTLAAFQARHGIQVVAISVDGGPLPSFPQCPPGQRHCHHPEGQPGARRLSGSTLHRKDLSHRLRGALGIPVA